MHVAPYRESHGYGYYRGMHSKGLTVTGMVPEFHTRGLTAYPSGGVMGTCGFAGPCVCSSLLVVEATRNFRRTFVSFFFLINCDLSLMPQHASATCLASTLL